jgi:hypothetical protein
MDNIAIFQLVLASIISYVLIGLTMWLFRTKDNKKEKLEVKENPTSQ